jgi:flavin reductase (DIM6/NTAB) family NADH-FMN oxidoreductase RutF
VPMVQESFLSMGCQIRHELFLGSHHLFVAEVVSIYGDAPTEGSGVRPQLTPEQQLAYLDGKYWSLQFVSDRV